MRSFLRLTLCCSLILPGCAYVSVTEPIGDQVELDEKHLELIEGRWQAGNSLFEVRHLDGSRFEITKIRDDESAKEKPATAILTQTDKEHTYFHIEQINQATGKKGYILLRLGVAGGKDSDSIGEVVLYMPNVRSFEKAVESGKLKGTIERKDDGEPTSINLSSPTADIERWLQTQENEPFALQQVFVARKIKSAD